MITKYNNETHKQLIIDWKTKRKLPIYSNEFDYYPSTGYVYNNIYIVFIYLTNSPICFKGEAISDPDVSKQDRQKAIIETDKFIINDLQQYNVKIISFSTNNKSVLQHALNEKYNIDSQNNYICSKYIG